jgi:hypothetical protein
MARSAEGGPIGRPAKPTLRLRGGIWHYRFTVAGRRFSGTTGESARGRAESILAARWYEAHQKARIPVASGPAVDLAHVSALWLTEIGQRAGERGPTYVKRHKLDVRYILQAFKLPGDVTDAAWQEAMRGSTTTGFPGPASATRRSRCGT